MIIKKESLQEFFTQYAPSLVRRDNHCYDTVLLPESFLLKKLSGIPSEGGYIDFMIEDKAIDTRLPVRVITRYSIQEFDAIHFKAVRISADFTPIDSQS